MVWVIRDEHGTLLGASAERRADRDGVMVGDGPYAAIGNAFGAYSTLDAAKGLTRAVENETGDTFEYAGFTLGMEHAVMVNVPQSVVEVRAKREAVRAVIDAAKARLAAVERYNDLRREGRTHADALVRQADRACETLLDELGTATMALRTLEGP